MSANRHLDGQATARCYDAVLSPLRRSPVLNARLGQRILPRSRLRWLSTGGNPDRLITITTEE